MPYKKNIARFALHCHELETHIVDHLDFNSRNTMSWKSGYYGVVHSNLKGPSLEEGDMESMIPQQKCGSFEDYIYDVANSR